VRADLQAFAVEIQRHGHAHGTDANQTSLHFFVSSPVEKWQPCCRQSGVYVQAPSEGL